ncbi:MAG: hypothetical protein QMD53_06875 [Actinomycetota bacterium]|nr:hypothetical protein [Actinomycetota bacterium]
MSSHSSKGGYFYAALIGAVIGGIIVATMTEAIPEMVPKMMEKMKEKMKEMGCDPEKMCGQMKKDEGGV